MKRKIALGPGAASLILIVVILSLCMLSMLMQIGARNDLSLATRGTEMITNVYDLFSRSEERLAKLDKVLARCHNAVAQYRETNSFADSDDEAYRELVHQNLPEGFTWVEKEDESVLIKWEEPLNKRVLTCEVKLLPYEGTDRTEWAVHTFAEPSQAAEDGEEFQ